jgi:hypothetical protein
VKLHKICNAAVLGVSLLMAGGAFAAEKQSVKLFNPVSVEGKTLDPGDYTVEWTGTGTNVELNFMQRNHVVATVPARVAESEKAATGNGITTTEGNGGSRELAQIRFRGKKMYLDLGAGQAAAK